MSVVLGTFLVVILLLTIRDVAKGAPGVIRTFIETLHNYDPEWQPESQPQQLDDF